MTKEELAAILNGRQYRDEITNDEAQAAKDAGLVVVFGASDDLMELRGAVDDETSGEAFFTSRGIFSNECDDQDCPYFLAARDKATRIEGVFDGDDYSWTYVTEIPHATFEIMEDGDKYCRGIVFALKDVKS
jgi:hypothetical protein